MKFYKCDGCGDEFDAKHGMIDGWYTHERKIQLCDDNAFATHRSIKETYIVRKTLKLYSKVPPAPPLPEATLEVKKDLCPKCIKLLEKP